MMSAALTPGVAAIVLFGTFFALFLLRVPVAFALGLACLPSLIIEARLSPMMLFNETFKAYNSFILLAVPFFLLTANLMNIGGITERMVRLSRTMVGNFPGALAQINVLLSVFFAGISGSSTADAASQSKIFIEAQVKEGYGLSFSIAITAVSAVLAVIIPPSILMIVWGGVISTSIGAMYLAGIIPGLLIAAAQMVTVHVYAKIYNYPVYPRATLKEFFQSAWDSLPALFTPFIIVGGILLGWFTATESAAIAVIYAAGLSIFVYREMDMKQLYHALSETGKLSAVDDPEMPAKNTDSRTLICASAPGKLPTIARDSRTRRSVMPPTLIRLAVSRSTSCCRSSSPACRVRRRPTRRARARSSSMRRPKKAMTSASRSRSLRCRRYWR